MTSNSFISTMFLGCIAIAFSNPVHADIMRCVDEMGTITYTNVPCGKDTGFAEKVAPDHSSVEKVRLASSVGNFTGWETRERATRSRANQWKMPVDVRTLQAARNSMLATDQASSFLRRQNVAALDLRN